MKDRLEELWDDQLDDILDKVKDKFGDLPKIKQVMTYLEMLEWVLEKEEFENFYHEVEWEIKNYLEGNYDIHR